MARILSTSGTAEGYAPTLAGAVDAAYTLAVNAASRRLDSGETPIVRDVDVTVYGVEREIGTLAPVAFLVSVSVLADVAS